jgi:hypothetical protein
LDGGVGGLDEFDAGAVTGFEIGQGQTWAPCGKRK